MRRILIVSVLLCAFLFASCSITKNQVGNNDWSYSLPNNYVIWHINSRRIICGKQKSLNDISTVVDKYVSEFCYNEQFICLKCVEIPTEINSEIDVSNPHYYIVNTEDDNVYGQLNEEEYLLKLQEYLITGLSEWIPTNPRPNGAVFS